MTAIGAPLGMLAFVSLTASACCAAMPANASVCYGGREAPEKSPDQPTACHATLSWAEHRKLRTNP